ncbi:hypothetical protein V9T40_002585 [Parthenolecanium corni]|uniref:Cytochrome P450 n=1 Tax=Parthenolecanium corni TaxID=536013 RepID=A0AAN9Y4L6_9HEMI
MAVLSSNRNIDKTFAYKYFYPWLGTGLLTANGNRWHQKRKILTPAFHFSILLNFFNTMVEHSKKLIEKLDNEVEKEKFNICPYISNSSLDIICETAMGVKLNEETDVSAYRESIRRINPIILHRAYCPWLWLDFVYKWTEKYREQEKHLKVLHGFSLHVGSKEKRAFLDLLLDISESGEIKLSDTDLREEVDTFMFEGHDTVSAAIMWSIFWLGTHRNFQTKLYEELKSMFGNSNRDPTPSEINELTYLDMVVKETLRICPSVPIISRGITEDVEVGGNKIPAGTTTAISLMRLHRLPSQYQFIEEFNPENFSPENVLRRHYYAYLPFSAGPRNCIGQKFGMMEVKVVLSTLFRNFEFETLCKLEEMKVASESVLYPESGIYRFISQVPGGVIYDTIQNSEMDFSKDQYLENLRFVSYDATCFFEVNLVVSYMTPAGPLSNRVKPEKLKLTLSFHKQFGPLYKVWLGPFPSVHITKPEDAEVIRQRKQQRLKNMEIENVENQFQDVGRKQKKMFLDLLLDVNEQLTEQLSEADIREEVDTFMFEGHDTTSAAVGWTIYLLGRHSEIQDKVVEELNRVFGSSDRPPTLDELADLKYLECVIKETLRLFPSVPFIARTLTEDVTMSGYIVPKGTTVRINIYQLHRQPNHFKDPNTFNPDNFAPAAIQNRHPFCYIPFSAGSRNCIGQKFAIMEEKVILSTFLRKYRVESYQKFEDLKLIVESIIHSEEEKLKLTLNFHEQFGPIYRAWLGPLPFVLIIKPEDAEVLLTSRKNINKAFGYNFFEPWLGTGLLTSSGSKWAQRRKMLTPSFYFSILQTFFDVFVENSQIFVEKLESEINSEEFNILPYIKNCTLDIICEAAMGVKVNAQQRSSEYTKSVKAINELIHERIFSPWMWPNFFYSFTQHYRKQTKAIKVLHDLSLNIIRRRKQQRQKNTNIEKVESQSLDAGKNQKKIFLDVLLDVSEQLNEQLSEADIREEVDTFMFEGHDTTAAATGWAIYLLGRHPDIQEKVIDELNTVFGSSNCSLTLDDLAKLKYLECVIKETLRLFPSVPFIARTLTEDVIMSGYTVPKGTTVRLNIYLLHRRPDHFKDPDRFNPDNFAAETIQNRHPFCYVPFSAGSRNCIGQKFAMMEEKVILSTFFRKYRVEAHQKVEDLKLIVDSITHPEQGLFMKIIKRT